MTVYCRECDEYFHNSNFNYDGGMCIDCYANKIKKGSEEDMEIQDTGIESNAGVPLTAWVYGLLQRLLKSVLKLGTIAWWDDLAKKNIVLFCLGLCLAGLVAVPFLCFVFAGGLWLCLQAVSFWLGK